MKRRVHGRSIQYGMGIILFIKCSKGIDYWFGCKKRRMIHLERMIYMNFRHSTTATGMGHRQSTEYLKEYTVFMRICQNICQHLFILLGVCAKSWLTKNECDV